MHHIYTGLAPVSRRYSQACLSSQRIQFTAQDLPPYCGATRRCMLDLGALDSACIRTCPCKPYRGATRYSQACFSPLRVHHAHRLVLTSRRLSSTHHASLIHGTCPRIAALLSGMPFISARSSCTSPHPHFSSPLLAPDRDLPQYRVATRSTAARAHHAHRIVLTSRRICSHPTGPRP